MSSKCSLLILDLNHNRTEQVEEYIEMNPNYPPGNYPYDPRQYPQVPSVPAQQLQGHYPHQQYVQQNVRDFIVDYYYSILKNNIFCLYSILPTKAIQVMGTVTGIQGMQRSLIPNNQLRLQILSP